MKISFRKPAGIGAILLASLTLLPTSGFPAEPTASPVPAPAQKPATVYLPANALEVLKLVQGGVGDEVVMGFVNNTQSAYNLSAKQILVLKDAGASSQVIAAMLTHDTALRSQSQPEQTSTESTAQYAPQASTPAISSSPTVATAPTVAPAPIIVEQSPPPVRVEIVPAAPGAGYVWAPGYWSWRGRAWVWTGGVWALPPRPHAVWVGGSWSPHGHGGLWIGGHWRL